MKQYLIIILLLTPGFCFGQYENLIKFEGENHLNGYKNVDGKIIVAPMYKGASVFNQGLALVSTDQGWTIIDNTGKQLVDFGGVPGGIYSNLEYALIRHKINGKWGFIDRKGNIVIDHQYDDTKDFNEGMAPVMVDGKWGFITVKNKIVIKPIFEDVYIFSEGLAAVRIQENWGFIDTQGNTIIEPKYTSVYNFSEGHCAVNTQPFDMANGGWANVVIDKKGNVIFTGTFYFFSGYSNGIANYWEGYHLTGKNIFIDRKGNIVKAE